MTTELHPIVSEFASQEEAATYDAWFRAKVQAALSAADDPDRSRYSSDEVARRMAESIHQAKVNHVNRRLA